MNRQRVLLLLLALSLGFWASTKLRGGGLPEILRSLSLPQLGFLRFGEEEVVAKVMELPRAVEEAIQLVDERYERLLATLVKSYKDRTLIEVSAPSRHPIAAEGAQNVYGATKEAAPQSEAVEENPIPDLEARGVASGNSGHVLLALVDGKMRSLRLGDRVGIWQVSFISPERVVFVSRGGARHEIPLTDMMRERVRATAPRSAKSEKKGETEAEEALSALEIEKLRQEAIRKRFEKEELPPPPPPTGDVFRGL